MIPPSPSAPAAPTRPAPVLPPLGEGAAEPVPGSMTFAEFLAGLNPLQHLPVVGTIYREMTGTTAPPVMRVLGGALLGGPFGMLSSAVMAAIDEFRAATPATRIAARPGDIPHGPG